ncbi:hypothetical protein [Penaeicola halotolerans]|uniref:hypothetical protein n=1 Tax=Penaeicola halotolerans TaxID=2793196 RepID=UPI001CF8B86E|nr:hypothetical protein [Penaeicola halotolerans]
MKIASLAEIKKELKFLSEQELFDLILELSKYSTDNKHLIFFQLFGRHDPNLYVDMVKEELASLFEATHKEHAYYAKKSLQGIRRKFNKLLKYNRDKLIQIDLLLHFCEQIESFGYLDHQHIVIENLYLAQIRKAENILKKMHEDIQADYAYRLENLKNHIS